MIVTSQQKLDCIEREIRMRERVYPRWVADKKMSQAKADEELATMRAIADDYRQSAESERLI
jgi:hypothetical protein